MEKEFANMDKNHCVVIENTFNGNIAQPHVTIVFVEIEITWLDSHVLQTTVI